MISSCEKNIDLDLPPIDQKVVVEGYVKWLASLCNSQ